LVAHEWRGLVKQSLCCTLTAVTFTTLAVNATTDEVMSEGEEIRNAYCENDFSRSAV
jgi:hypothetical protein